MKSSYTIPTAIVLGGIIVATAVYISTPKPQSAGSGTGNPALVRPVGTSDHVFGNPAAKVMIVEYADYDCEYCKDFDKTLRDIIATEGATGKVAWVFREFPLIEIHPNAMQNAEAAECVAQVGGNDAFWKFKETLFANQPVDPNRYGSYVKDIGVSTDAFATCFSSASTTLSARINADRQNAFDIGAQGTPYSFILVTGKPPVVISGLHPYDEVQQLVEDALVN